MLFVSERSDEVTEMLSAAHYRRVLDVPAVPVVNPCGLRYPTTVSVLPGPSDWYLRSFGTGFDLVSRKWRRQSRRWFSLGWGLAGQGEVDELLLIQAWVADRADLARELEPVRRLCGERYAEDVDRDGCVRVAAVLHVPGEAGDG